MNRKIDECVQLLNVVNLYPGLEVKNYKELCSLLNEPVKNGNAKLSQLSNWQRYFSFTKRGYKYIIEEIYPTPKPRKDNSLYIRFIEYILANELSMKRNGESDYAVNYTKTNLFHVLGMANSNYLRNNRKETEKNIEYIPRWQIYDFYKRSDKQLSKILFDSLNSMKNRSLLDYKRVKIIVQDDEHRIASNEEESFILEEGNKVLIEMKLAKKPFWNIELMNQFYSNLNEKLYKEKNWDYVYSEIRIIYTRKQIQKNLLLIEKELIESIAKRPDLLRNKIIMLNDNTIASVNKLAIKCFSENEDKYNKKTRELNQPLIDEGWTSEEKMFYKPNCFKYPDDFIDNQKRLSELFLRIYQMQENIEIRE